VPATPVATAPEAQFAFPGSGGAPSWGPASTAEHTLSGVAGGPAGEPAWQRRHAALSAYLHRAESAELELQHELEALPVRRVWLAPPAPHRVACADLADLSRSQAKALAERASALQQRALLLSCAEADELVHAAGVLGQPAAGDAGRAQQPSPEAEPPGATRVSKRVSKRKQASMDTSAAAGATPAQRGGRL
jgi:hypothetical protein